MLCFGLLHDAVRLRAPLLGTSPGKKIVSRASILNQFSDQAKGTARRFQHLDGFKSMVVSLLVSLMRRCHTLSGYLTDDAQAPGSTSVMWRRKPSAHVALGLQRGATPRVLWQQPDPSPFG